MDDEKRLINKIEKLCKDSCTDALLYLCQNYGDAVAVRCSEQGLASLVWLRLVVQEV